MRGGREGERERERKKSRHVIIRSDFNFLKLALTHNCQVAYLVGVLSEYVEIAGCGGYISRLDSLVYFHSGLLSRVHT